MRRLGNVREGARERSRGGEGTFARGRVNVREGARECSRGGEGTFVRDEGTFARGDLQGHRSSFHPSYTCMLCYCMSASCMAMPMAEDVVGLLVHRDRVHHMRDR